MTLTSKYLHYFYNGVEAEHERMFDEMGEIPIPHHGRAIIQGGRSWSVEKVVIKSLRGDSVSIPECHVYLRDQPLIRA